MNKAKVEELLTLLKIAVGDDAYDKVDAVQMLVAKLVDCRETPTLVGEAMQPWLDDNAC